MTFFDHQQELEPLGVSCLKVLHIHWNLGHYLMSGLGEEQAHISWTAAGNWAFSNLIVWRIEKNTLQNEAAAMCRSISLVLTQKDYNLWEYKCVHLGANWLYVTPRVPDLCVCGVPHYFHWKWVYKCFLNMVKFAEVEVILYPYDITTMGNCW